MIIIAISFHGNGGKLGAGGSPQKLSETTPFLSNENAPFYIIGRYKGHFRSFAEKDRGPDPQNHP